MFLHRCILLALIMAGCALHAGAQSYLNRLVCTAQEPLTNAPQLVFTDAESGTVTRYYLPPGYVPGTLVAMDRYGDVWLDEKNSNVLRRFSGSDGSVSATVTATARPGYMITDQNADLIVNSYDTSANPQMGVVGGVYLQRFSVTGVLLNSVSVANLFPPGEFWPWSDWWTFQWGSPRMLVTRTGDIWMGVPGARRHPVFRLDSNFTVEASYGIYYPCSLLPDTNEGIWVLHATGILAANYPSVSPALPGLPNYGWLHLSASGSVLESTGDGTALGTFVPSHGMARSDGRQFQYSNPGGPTTPPRICVHKPGFPAIPWYPPSLGVLIPGSPQPYLMGFQLDGHQRLWALTHTWPNMITNTPGSVQWMRFPIEQPYSNPMVFTAGDTFRVYPQYANTFFWTTDWGHASLYEYAFYTDPYGDLDGDGVSNQVELSTFSNPLLPNNFSNAVTASGMGTGPGSIFSVSYQVPNDAGLAYAAPFALAPSTFPLGGGWFLPVHFFDPLVQLTIQPSVPGVTNTIGVLDVQGRATASILVPNDPALSGFGFATCIVTVDPNLPLPFKTVSPAFHFQIS